MEKKKRTNWFNGLFVIALMIGIPGITQADLNEIVLKFHPYVSVQEEYSSNVNLAPKDKKADYITNAVAGFTYSTPKSGGGGILGDFFRTEEKSGIDLSGQVGYTYYAKGNAANYLNLSGNLNTWYTWANRLTLRLNEYIVRSDTAWESAYPGYTPENVANLTYLPGTQRQRSIWDRNVFSPTVEYRFSEHGQVSLNYRNNLYWNESQFSENSQENYFNPKLTYWFDIRNGIILQYGYVTGNFETSSDFTGHTASGRYIHRFNPMTSIFAQYTYGIKNFDQPGSNYDVNSGSFGVEHQFSPTLALTAGLGYFYQSPETGKALSGPTCNIVLTQRAEKTVYALLLQGGYQESFFTAQNLGFTKYYRAIGTVTQQIMERLSAGLLAQIEWDESPINAGTLLTSDTRRDTIWMASGNVSYKLLKWLTLSVSLSYRNDNSSISTFDYKEYRALFRVYAQYL